jgi:hypothetical protein
VTSPGTRADVDRCFICLDESASVSSYCCGRKCKNALCGACALEAPAKCLICRESAIVGLPDTPKRRALLTVASDARSTLEWLSSSRRDDLVWMFWLKCRLSTFTRYSAERNPSDAVLNMLFMLLVDMASHVSMIYVASLDDGERSVALAVAHRISVMMERMSERMERMSSPPPLLPRPQ